MFWRALVAFLACPGTVAIAVPIVWLHSQGHRPIAHLSGIALLLAGFAALLWCVRDFYVSGKGTLAPWAPPRHLVTVGLYRYSRNPMYVAVSAMLLGWAIAFASTGLLIYALAVMTAFHFRVVLGEEPWLLRTHGEQWQQYKTRVRRWL
jgi:protein-S-isoprenylcysteine O-methyltransferase Ste14